MPGARRLALEVRAQVAQQLAQSGKTDGDFGETAAIHFPKLTQIGGRWRQEIQNDALQRLAVLAFLFYETCLSV